MLLGRVEGWGKGEREEGKGKGGIRGRRVFVDIVFILLEKIIL